MLKPTSIDHEIRILPENDADLKSAEARRVVLTPDDPSGKMKDTHVVFELPQGSSHHDAILMLETLKNINAEVKLMRTSDL